MKTIVITGPTGSGKSYLSNKLSKLFNNSIVINTDSYYRDNLYIRFLSIFVYDIYDRLLSIRKNKIKRTIISINNKDSLISFYNYDFKKKYSTHSKQIINYKVEKQFLILEGIFSHRLELNYKDTINIVCEEDKEICFKRRLIRDQKERGRKISEVNRKFKRSWYLFYLNIQRFLKKNRVIRINTSDNHSYDKLIFKLKKYN